MYRCVEYRIVKFSNDLGDFRLFLGFWFRSNYWERYPPMKTECVWHKSETHNLCTKLSREDDGDDGSCKLFENGNISYVCFPKM